LLFAFVYACLAQSQYGVTIDPNMISVSGLSSGGFMAVQMHVAYSKLFMGAGIFAGGPYYCAQNSLTYALVECMYGTMSVNVQTLISYTDSAASSSEIDPTSNLCNDKVFLYSGTSDSVVNPATMHALESYYANYITCGGGNITTQFDVNSQHCMPTTDYGNSCTFLGEPYINDCNYDGAGNALNVIYGKLEGKTKPNPSNIISFAQDLYVPSGYSAGSLSLGDTGYAYIPTGCQNNANKCALHLAFHGCSQTIADIGDDYYTQTGFNDWAESNNIVVVYPQAVKSTFSPTNPEGCFDWWGYTTGSYVLQSGPQMQTFRAVIKGFAGV